MATNVPMEEGGEEILTSQRNQDEDTKSHSSVASSLSLRTAIAKKRAEAAAKKVALRYTREQAEIKKIDADVQADLKKKVVEHEIQLETLEHEKEVEMCQAEISVLEEELSQSQCSISDIHSIHDQQSVLNRHSDRQPVDRRRHLDVNVLPTQSAYERTREYVNKQKAEHENVIKQKTEPKSDVRQTEPSHTTNPVDISKLMLKKELLMNRLRLFNDKPESYPVWKETFKNISSNFELDSNEEFDLLIKWLGPNSRLFAETLRAANMKDPKEGLRLVWQRLDERYGSPVQIEMTLTKRLNEFPKIGRDNTKLYELADLLTEINCLKSAYPNYKAVLSHFDSAPGVIPIVQKLPNNLQERWLNKAFDYKEKNNVTYPPFSEFVTFVNTLSRQLNDPSLQYPSVPAPQTQMAHVERSRDINSNITDFTPDLCSLHNSTSHALSDCLTYLAKPGQEKWDFVKSKKLCFRCIQDHHSKDCRSTDMCEKCGSPKHHTSLHIDGYYSQQNTHDQTPTSGDIRQNTVPAVTSSCTKVYGGESKGRSCARHVLVYVYLKDQRHKAVQMYATIDDQSNASLCKSTFFDCFRVESQTVPYTLTSCSGKTQTAGRLATGFVIESHDGNFSYELPTLIECNDIPDRTDEIPTPEVAYNHAHLRHLTHQIPPLTANASIELLIGRDLPDVHHVMDQVTGPLGSPYAQRLPLGWVIIGNVCPEKVYSPNDVYVQKTHVHILPNISSPAVATHSLRRPAQGGEDNYVADTKKFVKNDFHVDDGIASMPAVKEANGLPARTESSRLNKGISGKCQSPVNLISHDAIYDSSLATNELNFDYSTSRDTDIVNNGHALVVYPRSKQVLSSSLLANGEEFELGEIRFHWGRENSRGSEHTVNNKAFPMEVQLIHWNSRHHGNIEDAMGLPGGVVITSLFTQIGREHMGLRIITDNLEDVLYKGRQKNTISAFNPVCLLPDPTLRDYWIYEGSMTSSPHCEEVTWILFRYPLMISHTQMEEFRRLRKIGRGDKLHTGDDGILVDNFRPTQPLFGRTVRASFQS